MSDTPSKRRPPDEQRKKRKKPRREVGRTPRPENKARGDLLDPTPLLLEAISKGLDAGYAEIDDRDIPKAGNVVDWLISPEFLNIKPYAKQLQDAIHVFSAACYFCSDTEYLVDIPVDEKISNILDRTTLMQRGRCPKCGRRVMEMRHEWCLDPANTFGGYIKEDPPNDICCLEGQRSGKSTKTAMYATWVLHRYLQLGNPTKHFGLLEAVGALHCTFVSVTAKQAWENLWQPFSDLIDSAPWFKQYHRWLKKRGEEVGMELLHKPDTYLWYGHKRLALSFAPADQRTLRGRTRFASAVDELGWFGASKDRSGTSRVRADGDGTVRALDRSLATIRNASRKRRKRKQNCPDAYQFTISSPSAATDPMMRRYKRAAKSPRMYSILRSTWESNPSFTEEGLREQEGDVSERDFQCDFACNPPYSDDPWWDNEMALLDICAKKDLRFWNGSIAVAKDPTSSNARYRFVYYKFSSITGDMGLPRCLAFDNGERHNSFAWAMGRYDKQNDMVIAEEVGEVAPGEHERIHHGLMWEHVIEPLVQRFRFLHVAWDRWESTRYVADLRTKYRVRAEQYSPSMKDGKQLRSDMANAKLLLPMPEVPISSLAIEDPAALARTPRAHLLLQFLTSRDGNGLPLKPQGGNDDILRAVLLLDRFVRDNVEDYSRYHWYGGGRCVGIGVGGAVAGGTGRGQGLVVGAGGRALGVGIRR